MDDEPRYSMDQVIVRMPIRMDALGETKIYVFRFWIARYLWRWQ